MTLSSNKWGALIDKEIEAACRQGALVVIPVGATEQHSGHLPVDTDTCLVERIALMAAERAGVPVLVTPSIAFGFSPHHRGYSSTITLSAATLMQVAKDVVESVHHGGFQRILLLNGHGGNQAPLRTTVAELVTSGIGVGYVDYWGPVAARISQMLTGSVRRPGHACEFETSLQLALHKDEEAFVHRVTSAVVGLASRPSQPYHEGKGHDPIEAGGAFWPPVFSNDDLGYFGDPAQASIVTGERILEEVVSGLATFYESFLKVSLRTGKASR